MSVYIRNISLFQFKNYLHQDFAFPERITGICGLNGVGKTNLLDAIHYLCFTRSYFSRQDLMNIHKGQQGFRLEGSFSLNDQQEKAVCVLRENGKKEFSINGEAYSRFSEHIGRYPLVIIAPDDVELIIGGSEERRKFIDTLISQIDPEYLRRLISYTRLLQQRNSFLKTYQDHYQRDLTVLDILDGQMAHEADYIFEKRREFLLRFLPLVKQRYIDICRKFEDVHIYYESELHQHSMEEILRQNRQKDLMIQRTSGGLHRDDLSFLMGEQPFRNQASQGQRKSLLFALKLSELEVILEQKHFSPLLLLDDVFEKLDEERISNLLEKVVARDDCQVFITDTSCQRLEQQLVKLKVPFHLIQL